MGVKVRLARHEVVMTVLGLELSPCTVMPRFKRGIQ